MHGFTMKGSGSSLSPWEHLEWDNPLVRARDLWGERKVGLELSGGIKRSLSGLGCLLPSQEHFFLLTMWKLFTDSQTLFLTRFY